MRLAGRIRERVPGVPAAVAAVLLGGWVLLFAFAWWLVSALHWLVGETVVSFDEFIVWGLHILVGGRLDVPAVEVTFLGSTLVAGMAVLVSSAVLWLHRRRVAVLFLVAGFTGAALLSSLLKLVFERPRPDVVWAYSHAFEASFPSGHSIRAVVVYAALAWLLWRLGASRGLRAAAAAAAGLAVIAIGASRVYLGVHFPSDVLAGYLLGVAWLAVCALAAEVAGGVGGGDLEAHETRLDEERGGRRGGQPAKVGR